MDKKQVAKGVASFVILKRVAKAVFGLATAAAVLKVLRRNR
jgi:hypothetical protein